MAWDCATGSGQAATALAEHFDRVVATDASEQQLESAQQHPRVSYRVSTAENCELDDNSVDLTTVGQAFHWFDEKRFFAEAKRVLRDDGVLAIWCYGFCRVASSCDAIVERLYTEIVGQYWPPERVMIEQGYANAILPGKAVSAPDFQMTLNWTADDMLGYLSTWSASKRYESRHGRDPIELIADELREAWGANTRTVVWPLSVRIARPNAVE